MTKFSDTQAAQNMQITVRYSAIDGAKQTKKFSDLEAARAFAVEMVGENPEMGSMYAISGDGIGKVVVEGISLADLFFPRQAHPVLDYSLRCMGGYYLVLLGHRVLTAVGTRQEAITYIAECRDNDAEFIRQEAGVTRSCIEAAGG